MKGFVGAVLGGWSYNGIWSFQSGPHWEPTISSGSNLVEISDGATPCTAADIPNNCKNIGGDFNLDGGQNDRPNASVSGISACLA